MFNKMLTAHIEQMVIRVVSFVDRRATCKKATDFGGTEMFPSTDCYVWLNRCRLLHAATRHAPRTCKIHAHRVFSLAAIFDNLVYRIPSTNIAQSSQKCSVLPSTCELIGLKFCGKCHPAAKFYPCTIPFAAHAILQNFGCALFARNIVTQCIDTYQRVL